MPQQLVDRAEVSILLALALEAASPECVGDEARAYCARWPLHENLNGKLRRFLLDWEVVEELLALFESKRVTAFIAAAAEDGPLTTAECVELEQALVALSSKRNKVKNGVDVPTIVC